MEEFATEHFWAALFLAAALFCVVNYLAYRSNYYTLPEKTAFHPIRFLHLAGIFGTFVIITLIFYPIMFLLVKRPPQTSPTLSNGLSGWLQLIYMVLLFLGTFGYLFVIKRDILRSIFFDGVQNRAKAFTVGIGMGILSWAVSYPTVLLVNIITGKIGEEVWGKTDVDQVAVKHLKNLMEHKWLYGLTVIAVVLLVPMVEELLFRGFLQTWLRRFIGRMGSLFCTALIFAFAHYAPTQGSANFELICSLFVLSCFLGFIYERQQTLWASIALHSTFNGMTVVFLTIQQYFAS